MKCKYIMPQSSVKTLHYHGYCKISEGYIFITVVFLADGKMGIWIDLESRRHMQEQFNNFLWIASVLYCHWL
jgi:hypothetical protein